MKIKQTLYIEQEIAKKLKHLAIDLNLTIGQTAEKVISEYFRKVRKD